ncbi:MFS transporter [Actinomyces sp. oral taxon 897]|uniref:MFS transporter n=1 Tax=Actinomyces sp. oral taxon 897 TaxID=2081702 RepID=UPI000D02EA45|nr:MFS transporter [Actinomyces sp. oral taxon 897]AVM61352.1 MFS transporter [Actinomyces sp. oral taxon 897]
MSQTLVNPAPPPAPQAPGARQWAALAVLTLAVTLLAIDSTVLALAIPSLSADLGPTATQLLWIGDVYSFTLAGLLVTMGNLADRVGRRRLLLIGTTGFGVSSVLAALAPSATALIAARALLGISGATIMPSTLSLIRNIFPGPRHRTTAIAVWSAGSSGGTALGPLVGGVLLEHFWWGSVFLINVPVMAAVVVTGLWLLPESRNDDGDPVDVVSAVLSVAAIVPVVYVVKSFAHDGPTLTAAVALVAGTVAGRAFLRRQRQLTTPLIDVGLFRLPAFTWAVVATVMAVFALAGLLYFFSQYLQLVRGYSTLQAGLTELPTSVSSIAVVAVVAWLVRRLGHGGALGGGLVLSAAGLVVVAVAESWGGIVLICVGLLIIGTGVGLAFTVSTGAVLGSVPASRAGAASAISETGLELGVALGIAVLGTVQDVGYRLLLGAVPGGVPGPVADAARQSLATLAGAADPSYPEQAQLLAQARTAFTHAMQATALVAAVILLLAGCMAARRVPAAGAETAGPPARTPGAAAGQGAEAAGPAGRR